MTEELHKSTLLITGSARGIGAATARLARARGATVILHGRTESAALRDLAEELSSPWLAFDVSDATAVSTAMAVLLDEHDAIDGLVNNAGVTLQRTLLELADDDWLDVFRTNLLGPVHLARSIG